MSNFSSLYFGIGILVIVVYAWPQFNKPSFQTEATLPRTVDPLRYLFLKTSYARARFTYVAISILLYFVLVLAGPPLAPIMNVKYDPATWPLLIALVLVGVMPNLKWLTAIEEFVRRTVHAWFLVPEGVLGTIAVLEDTNYEPSQDQLEAVTNPALRSKVSRELRLPVSTLQYRWARASMLMTSLQQMRAPLRRTAFDPFELDFEEIRTSYRALRQQIEQFQNESVVDAEGEDTLIQQVDKLLKRIYAYISWGVRYQADTEHDVDDILTELGFRIPPTGRERLLDIVALPVVLVLAIITAFWVVFQFYFQWGPPDEAEKILWAFSAGITGAVMYGMGVRIALKQRSNQIDQGRWLEGSPTCLFPIALRAGLVAWAVIAVTSILTDMIYQPDRVTGSVTALIQAIEGSAGDVGQLLFLPDRIISAGPWIIAGAMLSVGLGTTVGRNITGELTRQRIRDGVVLAVALGSGAAVSQILQSSIAANPPLNEPFVFYPLIPFVALVGAACGGIIGYSVPTKCRANLRTPPDRIMAQALQGLRAQAKEAFGDSARVDAWLFQARSELGGITPAEAAQYKGRATSASRLLAGDVRAGLGEDSRRPRSGPVVIRGGRGSISADEVGLE